MQAINQRIKETELELEECYKAIEEVQSYLRDELKIDQTAIAYDSAYTWHPKEGVKFPTIHESKQYLKNWNDEHRIFFYGGIAFSNTAASYTIIALIEATSLEGFVNKFWLGGLRTNGTNISNGFGEGSGTGGCLYSSAYDKYIYRHSDEWNAIQDKLNKHTIPTKLESILVELKAQKQKLEKQIN